MVACAINILRVYDKAAYPSEKKKIYIRFTSLARKKKEKKKTMESVDICFLAVAIGDSYEQFVPAYTVSVLFTVPNSFVEIIVRDPAKFKDYYKNTLAVIDRYFPNHYMIRTSKYIGTCRPNTVRFVEKPQKKCTLTYIAEIDIIFLDANVGPKRLEWMEKNNLPYSNIRRDKIVGLSGGRHCVITRKYYTEKFDQFVQNADRTIVDETYLHRLCKTLFGIPNSVTKNCWGLHGFHPSLNRVPSHCPEAKQLPNYDKRSKRIPWTIEPHLIPAWENLITSDVWKEVYAALPEGVFKQSIDLLQKFVRRRQEKKPKQ
jgi:hypothetical protein